MDFATVAWASVVMPLSRRRVTNEAVCYSQICFAGDAPTDLVARLHTLTRCGLPSMSYRIVSHRTPPRRSAAIIRAEPHVLTEASTNGAPLSWRCRSLPTSGERKE